MMFPGRVAVHVRAHSAKERTARLSFYLQRRRWGMSGRLPDGTHWCWMSVRFGSDVRRIRYFGGRRREA
jgi:hypothetical protein